MGYKSGNSIKKGHVRNYLDKWKSSRFSFTVNYLPNNHYPNEPYYGSLNFFKCLVKLNLGTIHKVRYRHNNLWVYNTYFESSPESIADWYLKFNNLPNLIKLKE